MRDFAVTIPFCYQCKVSLLKDMSLQRTLMPVAYLATMAAKLAKFKHRTNTHGSEPERLLSERQCRLHATKVEVCPSSAADRKRAGNFPTPMFPFL